MNNQKSALILFAVFSVFLGGVLIWTLSPNPQPLTETAKEKPVAPAKNPAQTEPAETLRGAPTETSTAGQATPERQAAAKQFANQLQGQLIVKGGAAVPPRTLVQAKWYSGMASEKKLHAEADGNGRFSIGVEQFPESAVFTAESEFLYGAPLEVKKRSDGTFPEIKLNLAAGGKIEGVILLPDQTPAKSAKVSLGFPMNGMNWMGGGAQYANENKEAITNDEGKFVFNGVAPGKSRILRASLKHYGTVLEREIEIRPLQTHQSQLTLTVESVVQGKVVDAQNSPVAGARIEYMPAGGMGELLELGTFANAKAEKEENLSDAAGNFTVDSLAPGKYRILAQKRGYEHHLGVTVTLAAGTTKTDLQITLQNGGSISGRVVDKNGQPIAGTLVSATLDYMSGEVMRMSFKAEAPDSTTTDANGAFTFSGMDKGPYKLTATHPERGKGTKSKVRGGNQNVEIKLLPTSTISGRVTTAVGNLPVKEFTIAASRVEGFMPISENIQNFKAEDGSFTLSGLSANSYTLQVSAEGFASLKKKVQVKESEDLKNVDIAMELAAIARGKVLSGSGEPIEGAEITGSSASAGGGMGWWQDQMDMSRPRARTDIDGAFELKGLSPGKLLFKASHSDYASSSVGPYDLKAGDIQEGLVFTMTAGGGVDGFFFNADGAPVSGAMISLFGISTGTMKTGRTDAKGFFQFERGLAPGKYQLSGFGGMGDSSSQEEMSAQAVQGMKTAFVDIEEGKVSRVILGEKKLGGCKITGRLLSGSQPVSGAYVSWIPRETKEASMPEMKYALSDKEGKFTLENIPAGKNQFNVQRGNIGTSVQFDADVPDQSEFTVEFKLPGGSLSGRITDARTGRPISELFVTLSPETESRASNWTGSGFGQAKSDEEGRYKMGDLKPGSYVLTAAGGFFWGAEKKGYGRATRTVTLGQDEARDGIDFALRPGGTIEGKVFANGSPVTGASVFFRDEKGQMMNALSDSVTDGTGHFQYEGLGEGNYTVFAKASGFAPGKTQAVQVRESSTTAVEIVLSPGVEVIVKVSDAEGKILEGVNVQAMDEQGQPLTGMMGWTDMIDVWSKGQKTGTYNLGTYAPGKYKIVAYKEGYTAANLNIEISNQATQVFELKMTPAPK